jgi:hypothetical protein
MGGDGLGGSGGNGLWGGGLRKKTVNESGVCEDELQAVAFVVFAPLVLHDQLVKLHGAVVPVEEFVYEYAQLVHAIACAIVLNIQTRLES